MSKGTWIGFGISAVLLAIFFLTIDMGRMLEEMRKANYLFVPAAMGTHLVATWFRTIRWQRLLRHMGLVGVGRLYPVVVVGYMANNLLPMRMGELVRSYYLGEREGISKVSALATIFVERLLDALTLLLFIALAALFLPVAGLAEAVSDIHGVIWLLLGAVLVAAFVAAFAIVLFLAYSPLRARTFAAGLIRRLPSGFEARLTDSTELFLNGLRPLGRPGDILSLFLLSVPIWLLESGLFFLVGLSFGLDHMYDGWWEMAIAMVLVTSIANIGGSVPAAPGGIGPFELVARETLVLLPLAAIHPAVASGYVVVVHASLLLPMIVLGQVFLLWQHASLRALARAARSRPAGASVMAEPVEVPRPELGEGPEGRE